MYVHASKIKLRSTMTIKKRLSPSPFPSSVSASDVVKLASRRKAICCTIINLDTIRLITLLVIWKSFNAKLIRRCKGNNLRFINYYLPSNACNNQKSNPSFQVMQYLDVGSNSCALNIRPFFPPYNIYVCLQTSPYPIGGNFYITWLDRMH